MDLLRLVILIAALLCTGLLAGLFYGFSIAVMPALARISDTSFVDTMQKINIVILNPWFAISFAGTFGFTVIATLLQIGQPALPWLIAALALNLVGYLITFGGNIPLNQQLDDAGVVDASAAAAVRTAVEARWVRRNIARTLAHSLATVGLALALIIAGP